MRALAKQIITTAAVAAGIDSDNVIDKPKKQSKVMLPKPRLEFETLTQDTTRDGRLFARLPAADPDVYIKHRKRMYKLKLNVRAVIRAESDEEVESLADAFLLALPGKTKDENDNFVKVSVERVERGGFLYQMVEVFSQRDVVFMITFEGGLYQDTDIPLIKQVDVRSNLTINP